jgi:LCP family protein required for cell wall assembly
MYRKMEYKEAESFTTQAMKEDGVINILLIGNDSRLDGDDGRSDAMILVSISDKTKTITMTSLLRDMYVEIPGHDGNRLNAAYSYGGPDLLMQTIEQNFDIPVHRYALVNFQAFANLVDAVGGVDLELTNDEVQYVNGYLMEYNQLENRDLATDFLDPSLSGMIHLNGPQALAYSRNRYIGTDFGRTERQRKVLSAVIQKLPGSVLTNGGELANGLFPNLTTNLKQNECYNLSLNAWKFLSYDMVQQCVPVEGTYSDATIREMAVLQVDFDANKQFLKSTLYGE